MAEVVLTEFQIQLDAFNRQIEEAIRRIETIEDATDATQKNLKDLDGSAGSAAKRVKEVGVAADATGKGLATATKNTGVFKDALGAAKNELNSIFPLFGRVAQAARVLGTAITTALGPVGIAIAAVVAAVGLLIKAFTGTQEGADKLARVTEVLSRQLDFLLGVAQRAGAVLFDIFSKPLGSLRTLANAITTTVTTAFESLANQASAAGDVIIGALTFDSVKITTGLANLGKEGSKALNGLEGAAKRVRGAFGEFREGLDDARKSGERIAAIDIELRRLALERAENEGRIRRELEEQRGIVTNVVKSSQERAAAAKRFTELQRQLTSFETRRLDLEIERGRLAASTSDTLDEEKIRIQELVGAKEEALAREAAATREVNNQINALNKAAADKAIAEQNRAAAEAQKVKEQEAAEAQKVADARIAAEQQVTDAIAQQQRERELAQADDTQKQILLAQEAAAKEIDIVRKASQTLREIAAGDEEALLAIKQREAQGVGLIEQNLQDRIAEIRAAAQPAEDPEAEAQKLQDQLDRRLAIIDAGEQALAGIISDAASGNEAIAENAAKALVDVGLKALEAQVPLWVAQITGTSLAQPDSVATFGTTGLARAAIITALLRAALGGVRAAVSGAFHDGGLVGRDGGTKVHGGRDGWLARVERGEYVMPTSKTARYMPYLEAMRDGTFEHVLAMSSKSNATPVPVFSDRGIVGAIGTAAAEERRQTEYLAMIAKGMRRGLNKRYHA